VSNVVLTPRNKLENTGHEFFAEDKLGDTTIDIEGEGQRRYLMTIGGGNSCVVGGNGQLLEVM
jgi:hypothetical protein